MKSLRALVARVRFRGVTKSTHQALADERNATVEIYINGEFFPRHEAKISVFDSGFLVGDGIWEGIRLHHDVFAFLDRHLDRLFAGSAATCIDLGMDRAGVTAALTSDRGPQRHARQRACAPDGDPWRQEDAVAAPVELHRRTEHRHYRRAQGRRSRGPRPGHLAMFTATVRRPPPDTLDQKLNCHSKLHEVIALDPGHQRGCRRGPHARPNGRSGHMQCHQLLHRQEQMKFSQRPANTTSMASPAL